MFSPLGDPSVNKTKMYALKFLPPNSQAYNTGRLY